MPHLLALIDGSIYSHSVCDHAAWIAKRADLSIDVLHVLGRRQTSSAPANLSGSIALGARTALLEELSDLDARVAKLSQQRGRLVLEDARQHLESGGTTEVSTRLRFGDLVETVVESERDAEMVVIGKRGEAADFATLHLGSNLERIVRSCQRPVFVTSRAFSPIKRFLIAYDGGTSSMKAVDYVARSPLFAGLECRLLTVGEDTEKTRRRLDDARAVLQAGGYSVDASILPGQPENVIADVVESEGIDLLAIGAYGHSRIRSLIIGSTTTAMVRMCKIPVMLFR